jgi:nucleotide-binding universal stress UspA family protein
VVKLKRILAPVEFSPRCRGAVHYAEALAARFHSDILLLHVVVPAAPTYGFVDAMMPTDADELTNELIAASTRELKRFPCEAPEGRDVRRLVMEGDPARVIVECAAKEACDLIVMPTHGYGPFRRFLLGSVAAKVLHDSTCPVITGPHLEETPDYESIAIRHVLVAIARGPHSRDVLCYAGRLAGTLGAKLTVVHAVPWSTASMGSLYFDPDLPDQLTQAAHDRIEFLLQDLRLAADIAIESGAPADVVKCVARKSGADLVVIGRGTAEHAHGHLPSNSYAIVRESPCPVMTL